MIEKAGALWIKFMNVGSILIFCWWDPKVPNFFGWIDCHTRYTQRGCNFSFLLFLLVRSQFVLVKSRVLVESRVSLVTVTLHFSWIHVLSGNVSILVITTSLFGIIYHFPLSNKYPALWSIHGSNLMDGPTAGTRAALCTQCRSERTPVGTCRNSAGHLRKIWGYSICNPSVMNGWAGFFCIISDPRKYPQGSFHTFHQPTIGTSTNLRFDLQKSAPSRLWGPVFGVKIGNSPKVQGKPTSKHKKPISIGFSPCDPPDDVQGVLSLLFFVAVDGPKQFNIFDIIMFVRQANSLQ